MTEAQAHLFLTRSYHEVGLVEEVLQQRIDGVVIGARTRHQSLPQAPAGIVNIEAVDKFVGGKQVVERQIQLGQTMHVRGDVP